MPKTTNQKIKLLYLLKILQEESDEGHPLSIRQLGDALARHDINAERKTIYADLEALSFFGMDIVKVHGRENAYFLGQRQFEVAGLKMLVDAVESAKFLTAGKSGALIQKICALAGRHQGNLMQRQVQVQHRAKTFNERTYYNVDTIHNAMAENAKISFVYYTWVVDERAPHLFCLRARHGGKPYVVSPWTLLWDDEFYYLVAYDSAAGMIKHYRVDKMDNMSVTEGPRDGREVFELLNIAQFSKSIFGMYGGSECDVHLRVHNRLVGVIIDRFGQDIIIGKSGEEHFTVIAKMTVSPQFFSWLLGFGPDAEVLGPPHVVQQVKDAVRALQNLYKTGE